MKKTSPREYKIIFIQAFILTEKSSTRGNKEHKIKEGKSGILKHYSLIKVYKCSFSFMLKLLIQI
jgi:hypothetical protein